MNIAYGAFVLLVWFVSTYMNVVMLLMLMTRKKDIHTSPAAEPSDVLPKVTIICPAYNEEATIADSLKALLAVDYPDELLQIIVVSDGSKDRTSEIVNTFKDPRLMFIDNKVNKGKAGVLNDGIKAATGDFIATMDADTEVSADVVRKVLPYFKDPRMGAVTVAVRVRKPTKLLEKVIEIEYLLGLSLWLKILSFLDSIHVTPGPFSMYRKSMLDKIGYFDVKNMTEDLEIGHRIQKNNYRIACCLATHVSTVIPNTIKGLYVQRKRWYTGALETFWQYRDIMFSKKLGAFGYILPMIYVVNLLGLMLFTLTTYLAVSKTITTTWLFRLTGWDFLTHMSFSFDPLAFSMVGAVGALSLITTICVAVITLKASQRRVRDHIPGFIGFLFIFLLYQIFWASSFYAALTRRQVKWR